MLDTEVTYCQTDTSLDDTERSLYDIQNETSNVATV